MRRIVEHIVDDKSLTELRLDMLARASLAVSTSSNFEVERAVDLDKGEAISVRCQALLQRCVCKAYLVLPENCEMR